MSEQTVGVHRGVKQPLGVDTNIAMARATQWSRLGHHVRAAGEGCPVTPSPSQSPYQTLAHPPAPVLTSAQFPLAYCVLDGIVYILHISGFFSHSSLAF
jgi:hypothetical protein